ncbi:hypothetical protein WR25_22990 [Diploscapter pachys]|uniref:Uncharacterized protein n=1 Tax=Diploscapter pachys TaxID=2018661 RepID=A0A2A2JWC2_9BILA|nr:hypothetical protein WR25_22990 [Diploscapter pachys]
MGVEVLERVALTTFTLRPTPEVLDAHEERGVVIAIDPLTAKPACKIEHAPDDAVSARLGRRPSRPCRLLSCWCEYALDSRGAVGNLQLEVAPCTVRAPSLAFRRDGELEACRIEPTGLALAGYGRVQLIRQPRVELGASGSGRFARRREALRDAESDEWVVCADPEQLARPEAEPRQPGGCLPFGQARDGVSVSRAVRPGLRDHSANRHAEAEFKVVTHEALPGAQVLGCRRPDVWFVHPPCEHIGPIVEQRLITRPDLFKNIDARLRIRVPVAFRRLDQLAYPSGDGLEAPADQRSEAVVVESPSLVWIGIEVVDHARAPTDEGGLQPRLPLGRDAGEAAGPEAGEQLLSLGPGHSGLRDPRRLLDGRQQHTVEFVHGVAEPRPPIARSGPRPVADLGGRGSLEPIDECVRLDAQEPAGLIPDPSKQQRQRPVDGVRVALLPDQRLPHVVVVARAVAHLAVLLAQLSGCPSRDRGWKGDERHALDAARRAGAARTAGEVAELGRREWRDDRRLGYGVPRPTLQRRQEDEVKREVDSLRQRRGGDRDRTDPPFDHLDHEPPKPLRHLAMVGRYASLQQEEFEGVVAAIVAAGGARLLEALAQMAIRCFKTDDRAPGGQLECLLIPAHGPLGFLRDRDEDPLVLLGEAVAPRRSEVGHGRVAQWQEDRILLAAEIERPSVHEVKQDAPRTAGRRLQDPDHLSGAAVADADRLRPAASLDPLSYGARRPTGDRCQGDTHYLGTLRQDPGYQRFQP